MVKSFWEKVFSSFIYMLPLSDAIPFGRYLINDFSFIQFLFLPALPIIILERIIPFGSLLIFILLIFAVVRNPKFSYFIKYNAMQAILINISLIIISFIFEILSQSVGSSLLIRTLSSTILISILAIVIFCVFECVQGKEPDLPLISEAVKIQI
ncbi:Tic20 family protein [Prochlorococcus sp. MIT 1223]|uniref:Tic20 family protein n=1 Tax=Prochlorococcus sp. MIT 1223 TaxID=3096217 RepID=UPI002A7608A2|nr:Tic20 family protein [Prochlorococcus sp. MIT 1223]